jgi:hypothetical protein
MKKLLILFLMTIFASVSFFSDPLVAYSEATPRRIEDPITPYRWQDSNKKKPEWYAEYSIEWGPHVETTHKGSITLREYDGYGNYKEATVEKSSDGTCKETVIRGFENEKDQKDRRDQNRNDSKQKEKHGIKDGKS